MERREGGGNGGVLGECEKWAGVECGDFLFHFYALKLPAVM